MTARCVSDEVATTITARPSLTTARSKWARDLGMLLRQSSSDHHGRHRSRWFLVETNAPSRTAAHTQTALLLR